MKIQFLQDIQIYQFGIASLKSFFLLSYLLLSFDVCVFTQFLRKQQNHLKF